MLLAWQFIRRVTQLSSGIWLGVPSARFFGIGIRHLHLKFLLSMQAFLRAMCRLCPLQKTDKSVHAQMARWSMERPWPEMLPCNTARCSRVLRTKTRMVLFAGETVLCLRSHGSGSMRRFVSKPQTNVGSIALNVRHGVVCRLMFLAQVLVAVPSLLYLM